MKKASRLVNFSHAHKSNCIINEMQLLARQLMVYAMSVCIRKQDLRSRGEAARVAEEAKNHFETGRCSDCDGFSARHSSREYGYYEQFRGFRSGPERRYE